MNDAGFDNGPRIFATDRNLLGRSGYLAYLGINESELYNKSLFEIGLGSGTCLFDIASHNQYCPDKRIKYTGTDVLLQIPDSELSEINKRRKQSLQVQVESHPSLFQSSNAAYGIHQSDNSYDFVISHLGMPEYANNSREVLNVIFEMIRVAKEKVAFSGGWEDKDNGGLNDGVYSFGGDDTFGKFPFKLKKLLDELSTVGITYERVSSAYVQLDTRKKIW